MNSVNSIAQSMDSYRTVKGIKLDDRIRTSKSHCFDDAPAPSIPCSIQIHAYVLALPEDNFAPTNVPFIGIPVFASIFRITETFTLFDDAIVPKKLGIHPLLVQFCTQ
jgi:hypothetical protein